MEAVLKNVAVTVELLAVAEHSGSVQHWDTRTLSRAFHWARYSEQVFKRYHNNSAIRRLMEQQLESTNSRLRAAVPGVTRLSFPDLSRCRDLLLLGLLSNPELPCSIIRTLFDSKINTDLPNVDHEDITGICNLLIQCKATCKVLSPLTAPPQVGADAEVQAEMLMEKLAALLSHGEDTMRAEQLLGSVLHGCEGAEQHFCQVITAALLTEKTPQNAAKDFVMDWLQREQHVLQLMCLSLPGKMLAHLAGEQQKFRDSYLGVLWKWASDMEYSIDDGEWSHCSTNGSMTFQELTQRFVELLKACPSLRENTKRRITALKVSDGDFDVEGLSVWADLHTALYK